MKFHSTRGLDKDKTFEEVLMQGLASDGGLFMPDYWPKIDLNLLRQTSSFLDVAKLIVPLYTSSSFKESEVHEMLDNTWHNFSEKELAPIKELNQDTLVLELFHGPTAAFKDFGLQLAAAFFNKSLKKQNKTAVVLGATSGDTGSAAIDACSLFDSIKCFILLPDGNMSEVQRRQMTTVDSENVYALRITGSFDDCQDIVKQAFNEKTFLNKDQYLLAVNSINWIRIVGQICYYFYASLKINNFEEPLNFSVPTGNFGNVFACYSAHKMGMPLGKILVAVNKNNILDRFFINNNYQKENVVETLSPSMDISIASNFERLIYDYYLNRNSSICNNLYNSFPSSSIRLDNDTWQKTSKLFLSYTVDDISTIDSMRKTFDKYNYLIDPHTAVANIAASKLKSRIHGKTVILATAHPAKFPKVVEQTGIKLSNIPKQLEIIFKKNERSYYFKPDKDEIFKFIKTNN